MITVVVLDMALCGTSMLAGVIHRLGVPMMGDNRRADRVEDLDVRDALQNEAAFAQLVKERSGQSWGFKWSELWRFAGWLKAYLERPIYLAIYKEPVSVARRRYTSVDLHKALDSASRIQQSLAGILSSGLEPAYALSYLEAIENPLAFVEYVNEAIGTRADRARIQHAAAYIQPGGYQEAA